MNKRKHITARVSLDFIDATGARTTCLQLIAGGQAIAAIDYTGGKLDRVALSTTLQPRKSAVLRLAEKCRARSTPQTFSPLF